MSRRMPGTIGVFLIAIALSAPNVAIAIQRVVSTTAQFSTALAAATTGDEIVMQPGIYSGGHYRANLQGVTIRSANPANQAIIDGGSNGIQLSDPSNVTVADISFRNQIDNGLNIDDAGTYNTPATNITLRNLTVRDIVSAGNHDGIKLSGVNDFLIDRVQVFNWGTGGSAVDMVGCHHGLIQNSHFQHTNTSNGGTTLQPKGGTKDVTIRANRIELPRGAGRAVQAGGSTGAEFFRYIDGDSNYEANQIFAEGNVIIGGSSSFSWVNIDGGIFHHNVVNRPGQWVARILNENQGNSIVDPQNGQFLDNRIIYNDTATEFSTAVNVGPETLSATYTFARNRWLNLANPTPAGSTPSLPVAETGGSYGVDPAAPIDAANVWDFPWGKWIVNATTTQQAIDTTGFATFRQAVPGASAKFNPLDANPLTGTWASTAISPSPLQLPAFSQLILINPATCPNCLGVVGDYNGDAQVNSQDYSTWRAAFATTQMPVDGNQNGIVDAADYVIWRRALGATVGSSAAGLSTMAIPEPATALLSFAALTRITLARRRQPRPALSPYKTPSQRHRQ
jgi:hypothetical protein